jgi:predicted RNA-binding Zn ribbon-like protein
VVFAHDTELALLAAVDLVNSAVPPDTLETVAQLDAFFTTHGYSGRRRHDQAEVDEVRALRPRLRELMTSERDRAAVLVNELLLETQALPQLVRHDGNDWHVHAIGSDSTLSDRILVETAMAMVDVIRTDEMSRLAVCADPDCDGLVLDLSRNRSRKFCSTTCGNRAAVAAYRARQSGEG